VDRHFDKLLRRRFLSPPSVVGPSGQSVMELRQIEQRLTTILALRFCDVASHTMRAQQQLPVPSQMARQH